MTADPLPGEATMIGVREKLAYVITALQTFSSEAVDGAVTEQERRARLVTGDSDQPGSE